MTKEKQYILVPGYAPLAASIDGEFINTNTKSVLTPWCSKQRLATRVELSFSVGVSECSIPLRRITVQRAMALCFIPIPEDLKHLPIEKIYACKKSSILSLAEAVSLDNIEWRAVKPKRGMMTVKVTQYSAKNKNEIVSETLIHGLKAAVAGTGMEYQRALAASKTDKIIRFRNYTFEITHTHQESE